MSLYIVLLGVLVLYLYRIIISTILSSTIVVPFVIVRIIVNIKYDPMIQHTMQSLVSVDVFFE